MKRQVLFAFGLLTFLNSHAMPPMYRRAERILVEGSPVRVVRTVYNGSFFAYGSESHDFNDFLVEDGKATNITKKFPQFKNVEIAQPGAGVWAARWQEPFKQYSGYYKDGKLTEVVPWTWNGYRGSLYMTGGGGDWIGGYSTGAGPENPHKTVGLAYNPKTGERIDIADDRYNQFVGASPNNTLVYMSDWSEIAGTFEATHGIFRIKNGVNKFLGYGFAFGINRHDQVLSSLATHSMWMTEADGSVWQVGSQNTNFQITYGALDDFGNVLAYRVDEKMMIANGDTWFPLESRIEGGYSLDNPMMDPVTGSLYSRIKGRESEGVYRFDPVPEPGTLAALGLGVAALLRKKRQV